MVWESHYHGGSWMTQFRPKKPQIDHSLWWMLARADDERSINNAGARSNWLEESPGEPRLDNSPLELIAPQQDLQQTTRPNITNTTRLITTQSQPQPLYRLALKEGNIWSKERGKDIYRLF